MKLAVLFPGIGYTCDKPLLYYAGKLAEKNGFEVKPVPYKNFPQKEKGDRKKMEQSFQIAVEQSEEILKEIKWDQYEDIVFISKSVGTIVAAYFMKQHKINGRSISFTPLEDTFTFAEGEGIMFHGTSDPWVKDSENIRQGCNKIGQTLYITENANHSLETGDVLYDMKNMVSLMERVEEFLQKKKEVRDLDMISMIQYLNDLDSQIKEVLELGLDAPAEAKAIDSIQEMLQYFLGMNEAEAKAFHQFVEDSIIYSGELRVKLVDIHRYCRGENH